jgi:hypothetical protein
VAARISEDLHISDPGDDDRGVAGPGVIQYGQAFRKPAKSPNAFRPYT